MAGKAVERKSFELTSRVNRVESTASFQTVRGQYRTDGNGKRITVVEGKSEPRPYTYFSLVAGKMQSLKDIQGALADIIEHGHYALPRLVDDINHGLEDCGRGYYSRGLDPSMTDQQRARIEDVRGLMDDGLCDFDLGSAMLMKIGLTAEQISLALT